MFISDVLYGEFEVDPVVEDLIVSKSAKIERHSSKRSELLNEREVECNAL